MFFQVFIFSTQTFLHLGPAGALPTMAPRNSEKLEKQVVLGPSTSEPQGCQHPAPGRQVLAFSTGSLLSPSPGLRG